MRILRRLAGSRVQTWIASLTLAAALGVAGIAQAAPAVSHYKANNIWVQIANQLHLGNQVNLPRVRHQIVAFSANPKYVEQLLRTASPYIYYVYHQALKRHMAVRFALLPFIESGYNPNAVSYVGAVGLWQMMPATASSYGMQINWWYDSRRDVVKSTVGALNYLVRLHANLGTWDLAAAAYNTGQGNVDAAIRINRYHHRATDYWALPLAEQTRLYVPKLLGLAYVIKHYKRFHIQLPNTPDKPYFATIDLHSQLSIQQISHLSGATQAQIRKLNAGMQRFATRPGRHFELLIPINDLNRFVGNYDKLVGKLHYNWKYYRVLRGENALNIANKFHTNVTVIRNINHLRNNYVRPGSGILVPVWEKHRYLPLGKITPHIAKPLPKKVEQFARMHLNVADLLSGHAKAHLADRLEHKVAKVEKPAKPVTHKKVEVQKPAKPVVHKKAPVAHKKAKLVEPAVNAKKPAKKVISLDESFKNLIKQIYD